MYPSGWKMWPCEKILHSLTPKNVSVLSDILIISSTWRAYEVFKSWVIVPQIWYSFYNSTVDILWIVACKPILYPPPSTPSPLPPHPWNSHATAKELKLKLTNSFQSFQSEIKWGCSSLPYSLTTTKALRESEKASLSGCLQLWSQPLYLPKCLKSPCSHITRFKALKNI